MATFRQRKSGWWQAIIRRKGQGVQSKTFELKVDAKEWARGIEHQMDRGAFVSKAESESTTLSECLDRYLVEVVPTKKSADKEVSKVRIVKNHSIASLFMAAIRGADAARYRDDRLKVVAPATVHRELAVLSHVFTIARKEWGMEGLSNPVESVRKPRLPQGRNRRVETVEVAENRKSEIELIFEASESVELQGIVLLAIETAMRRGEMVKLEWKHFNLKDCTLTLLDTKNGEMRVVPLSSQAMSILKSLPRRIDGKVFGLRPDSITHAFSRACIRAGVKNLQFRDLRHESASRLFEKGLDSMEVASITGHKTLQMLKRYTHLRAKDLAKKLG